MRVNINGVWKEEKNPERTISLTGAVTGSASFDGSQNISINTIANNSFQNITSGFYQNITYAGSQSGSSSTTGFVTAEPIGTNFLVFHTKGCCIFRVGQYNTQKIAVPTYTYNLPEVGSTIWYIKLT